jgi:CMP-2-keto-3-deoxyoctulosonic acid synthetase
MNFDVIAKNNGTGITDVFTYNNHHDATERFAQEVRAELNTNRDMVIEFQQDGRVLAKCFFTEIPEVF